MSEKVLTSKQIAEEDKQPDIERILDCLSRSDRAVIEKLGAEIEQLRAALATETAARVELSAEVARLTLSGDSSAPESGQKDDGLLCEDCDSQEPLTTAICLGCWNKLAAEVIQLRKFRPCAPETTSRPVAWRLLLDSAYELHPRYAYFDDKPAPTSQSQPEPLYEHPSQVETKPDPPDREAINALALECAQASATVRRQPENGKA